MVFIESIGALSLARLNCKLMSRSRSSLELDAVTRGRATEKDMEGVSVGSDRGACSRWIGD
jgi:hypothetical protein